MLNDGIDQEGAERSGGEVLADGLAKWLATLMNG